MELKNNIAIIPARGGSKRIPKKNIRPFLTKPIIAYVIEAALASNLFDEVMVSTDDTEIAEIAKKYGASVPFLRSGETANDFATTSEVLLEVLNNYQQRGSIFNYACCIYPTAVFTTAAKLLKAKETLELGGFDTVLPVLKYSFPIERSFKIFDKKLTYSFPEYINTRSQDLQPSYHDAGQFYFFKVDAFLKNKKLTNENTGYLIVGELEAQDIDNEEDWAQAEFKYNYQKHLLTTK